MQKFIIFSCELIFISISVEATYLLAFYPLFDLKFFESGGDDARIFEAADCLKFHILKLDLAVI